MIRWLALFSIVALALLASSAWAETYTTTDGQEYSGEAMGPDSKGVIIKKTDGNLSERIPWTKWSQDALKKMSTSLPKTAVQRYVEPLLEEDEPVVETKPRAAAVQLKFTPPARLDRPTPGAGFGALFSSPLTLFLFLLLYGANIYAGYEISKFRNYSPPMVCGIAAVAPVIGPIIFLSMRTNVPPAEEGPLHPPTAEEQVVLEAAGVAAEGGVQPEGQPAEAAPAAPALPEPLIYRRGTTTFNRRFIETKLAGFLKVVPGEEEKDMLIYVKSARGDYIGQRLSKVQPNEFYLLVRKGEATTDVMIPYGELFEIKVQHKDLAP